MGILYNYKHGHATRGKESKIYRAWRNMMDRCYNSNADEYKDYGARGIKVYPAWHAFTNFLVDVGEPSSTDLTLDRITNDSDYEPGNVRWATWSEQNQNQRSTKLTRQDVDKIRELYATGDFSQSSLGRIFGVRQSHIFNIVNNKKWRQ
jgi:hypothetical protein